MIQRIQTIFLSIALLLMGILFFIPLAEVAVGEKLYAFGIKGLVDSQSGNTTYAAWALFVYLLFVVCLQAFIIFSFKKRVLQMRLATFNLILMLGFVLLGWLFVKFSLSALGEGVYSLKLPLVFPFASAVLNYLAIRAILKDELLIRSIDRIR
ncbi:MAG TPA: DUF4293 domain-containing protein [Prolixibacteraceae bacterium]|jgi:hypothetical protein|nr:DUF4293 domain-containing protein [Prolixibacteraceae bacterium]HUM89247.1 DUF4293 domain-containing protein [Prolixibacteraceae bacterium]